MIHFISKVGRGLFTGLVEDDKRKKMDAMNLSLPGKIIWAQNGAFFTFFAIDYLKKIAELCKKDFMISENG